MAETVKENAVEQINPISKGLSYTKKEYEVIVEASMNLVRQAKKNKWSREMVANLYGTFYASMAGLIRSGALTSRDTGIDGLPEIHVIAGEKEFRCRESAIYAILREETGEIVTPYEDTFMSYAGVGTVYSGAPEEDADTEGENDDNGSSMKQKRKRKKTSSDVDPDLVAASVEQFAAEKKKLTVSYERQIIQLKDSLKKAETKAELLEAASTTAKQTGAEMERQQALLLTANSEIEKLSINIEKLENEKAELINDAEKHDRELEAAKKRSETLAEECNELKIEMKTRLEEANADHYYDTVLPDLLKSIDFTKTDLMLKASLIVASMAGIVVSFLFFV